MAADIGDSRECFFDLALIDAGKTTAPRVWHKPEKREFCAFFDEEWENEAHFMNLFYDVDRYRMYYAATKTVSDDYTRLALEETHKLCYMESFDGIKWIKPELGICEFKNSKKNNIVIWDWPKQGFYVFKDGNPECPPDEKYKIVYLNYDEVRQHSALRCMVGGDGIRFREGWLMSEKGTFDTQNVAFYDARIKKYVCYIRDYHDPEQKDFEDFKTLLSKEETAVRDIRVMYSDDFKTWTTPKRLAYSDNKDMGLYMNCVSIYPRAPQYYLGFPTRYVERKPWTETFDNLCGREERKGRMKIHPRFGLALTDCLFMASRDRENWERPDGAFMPPGYEHESGWQYGDCYFAVGTAETKNGLYGHKELSLYCPEGLWNFESKLARYTLRLDGFVSFRAGGAEKKVTTKSFTFKGEKLFMNLATSAAGYVKVSISDGKGRTINSGEIFGDCADKEIWFTDGSIKDFCGKRVKMTITLKEADIYSFRFGGEKEKAYREAGRD